MQILVIIITYNAMPWAERCLGSLMTSSIVPTILVIDNGSTDGTPTFIIEKYPNVIFRQSGKNLGFGRANNLGLKYALENDFNYVYLLNQDAWVAPDTFEKLIKISTENPDYGLISPMQMNADLYHIDKNFCYGLFDYKNKEVINDLYNGNLKNIYETTPFIMAAHWFMTQECIEKVGGFSPTFKHYGEDNNYAERVVFHGFKIGVAPLLRVVHDRSERVVQPSKEIFLNYIFFLVNLSSPYDTRIIVLLIKMIKNQIYNIIKHKSLKPISYIFQIVLQLPTILKNRKISQNIDCAFLC